MDIKTLVIARFAVEPGPSLIWRVSTPALSTLAREGIPFNEKGEFAPPDEWRLARNLCHYDALVAAEAPMFREYLTRMIRYVPKTLDQCAQAVLHSEYHLLLSFGGQDVYDFFARDHRFGAPPRGRLFRSNLRGEWREKVGVYKVSRPDNALWALEQRIIYYRSMGADVTAMECEYARRQAAIKAGQDWKEGAPGLVRGGAILDPNRPKGSPGRKRSGWRPEYESEDTASEGAAVQPLSDEDRAQEA